MATADELEKLTALKEKGALSQEEFERVKGELLLPPRKSRPLSTAIKAFLAIGLLFVAGSIWYYNVTTNGTGIPACDSTESTRTLKSAFDGSQFARTLNVSAIDITAAKETHYDDAKRTRFCTARITMNNTNQIPVTFEMTKRDSGGFMLQFKVTEDTALEKRPPVASSQPEPTRSGQTVSNPTFQGPTIPACADDAVRNTAVNAAIERVTDRLPDAENKLLQSAIHGKIGLITTQGIDNITGTRHCSGLIDIKFSSDLQKTVALMMADSVMTDPFTNRPRLPAVVDSWNRKSRSIQFNTTFDIAKAEGQSDGQYVISVSSPAFSTVQTALTSIAKFHLGLKLIAALEPGPPPQEPSASVSSAQASPTTDKVDEAFSASFQCPESYATDDEREKALKEFMLWVQKYHGDWTIEQLTQHRVSLLELHRCKQTLDNLTKNTAPIPHPLQASPPASPVTASSIADQEAERFLSDYISVSNAAINADEVLRFYAPNVDYYKKGLVSKDYVEADKARYFKHWPKRTFVVKGNLVLSPAANGIDKNISYIAEYHVSNNEKSLTGKAAISITLTKKDDQLLIIKEAEDVFRN